jgi:hypothetical protein
VCVPSGGTDLRRSARPRRGERVNACSGVSAVALNPFSSVSDLVRAAHSLASAAALYPAIPTACPGEGHTSRSNSSGVIPACRRIERIVPRAISR